MTNIKLVSNGNTMKSRKNISPEIEAALAEGREIGLREAATLVASLRQRFVPWLLRGLGDVPETDAEGWGDLKPTEKQMMEKAAKAILRLIDGSVAPSHEHVWSSNGAERICAVCGMRGPYVSDRAVDEFKRVCDQTGLKLREE